MKPSPWIWSNRPDPKALRDQFNREGYCWLRMPEAVQLAERNPALLIETFFGSRPMGTHVNQIRVKNSGAGRKPYAVTNEEAEFHIDQHPYLPPAVQVLVCVNQATDSGGSSQFIDTWSVLEKLKAGRNALYERLFTTPRIIRFHNFLWCGPTFSLRAGNLVCVHNGFPLKMDQVGLEFQALIDQEDVIQFKMQTGDLLINNNHRTLHARTAFTDLSRHLIRILAWFANPLPAPEEYAKLAVAIAQETEKAAVERPLWLRKRLGLSGRWTGLTSYGADELLAHYRGELAEDPTRVEELIRAYAEISDSPFLLDTIPFLRK